VSLVLCVAALALWCESYWRMEAVMLRCGPDSLVAVESRSAGGSRSCRARASRAP